MKHIRFLSVLPFLLVPVILSTVQVIATVTQPSADDLAASQQIEATVLRVINGAAIEVSISGEPFTVSYLGVDLTVPSGNEFATADFMYAQAQNINQRLVTGATVTLERDAVHTDASGALPRWVWLGDTLVNGAIIKEGVAKVNITPPDDRYEEAMFAAQTDALMAGKGLWIDGESDCATCKYLQDQADEAAGYTE